MSISIWGQSPLNTKAYILYKGYPYVVYLSPEGEITEFIRAAPEVMKGIDFDKNQPMPIALGPYVKPQYVAELPVYNSPLNTTTVGEIEILNSDMAEGDVDQNNEEVIAETDVETVKDDFKPTEAVNFKTVVINKENEETKQPIIVRKEVDQAIPDDLYVLKFQGFTSRLTPALIDMLSDISKEHKLNSDKSIVINSFMTQGDASNRKLAENRMAACRDLLSNYGVPADKLVTEILPYNSSIDGNVSIKFED